MKFKKLFAGVAAAATLLAGMAFGTGAANAAETTVDTAATVTFKASKEKQLTSAQLSAYKIADYVNCRKPGVWCEDRCGRRSREAGCGSDHRRLPERADRWHH
jgi:anaerobic selenocysteine-containing dehydrogenase